MTDSEQQPEIRDARALFPELIKGLSLPSKPSHPTALPRRKKKSVPEHTAVESRVEIPTAADAQIVPPSPPDISWIKEGICEEKEKVEDIPTVLLLMNSKETNDAISSLWQDLGYRVESAATPEDAVARLRFMHFSAVMLHVSFGGVPLSESKVHNHLAWLPGTTRRAIFYILAGPDFHTLYDLEALSLSANLVVNDNELDQLQTILRKSFPAYEELFGPLLEAVNARVF